MKNLLVCSVLFFAFFSNRVQGKCNPLCGTGVYWNAGTCQPSGRCLCFWGWTGPNAQYTTNNRILADYCRIPCHYTPDYKNPDCVSANQTAKCKVPTSTTPTKPCDPKCGNPPYFGRGICLSDGRCLCWWGWTGPNACYVEDGEYKNRIIADYCARACHFTPYVRNPKCLNGSWDGEQVTKKIEKKTTEVQTTVKGNCNPLCGTGVYWNAGTCQPSGRCLCFWGWTGPNAQYTTNNRILADYCRIPCHYTPDYKNPDCVKANQTAKCKVPTSTTPTKPCDPKCGNPPYFGRGICLSDGRCLCWWGWTGPNACYVEDGEYKNRIIADYCARACHFTPYVRNPKCLNGSWDGEQVTKKIEKKTTEVQTTVKGKCNPLCGTGVYWNAGTCQPSGRCLCFWGWTGPNAQYTTNNRILADYCRIPCHYTPDYKNPDCVSANQTAKCKVPTSTTPTKPCDPKCGNPPYFGRGICLSDGRCLCWWGWTGPNACYVEDGEYKNRIIADYCARACHFTPYVRNPKCLNGSWDGEQVTKKIEKKTTEVQTTVRGNCNPLCGTGVYWNAGTCQPSGRCLCFWGWTGPNAQYTTNNRILADYCRIPCHYTPDYKNPDCVKANQTAKCKVPTSTTPTKPCDPKCGNPPYFGRGICLSDGRCLCWWGWTGPNACYVEDGEYKNRIIADYCARACHFTPYVRNPKCLNGSWDEEQVTKKIEKKPNEVQANVNVPCNPLCGTGVYTHAGTCQPDGRCLCVYGWTGPHAQYTAGNRILADYCRVPCHYTHDYENPECVNSNHTSDECKVPDSTTPTTPCDPRCGKPPYYGKGQCLSNGRCLCWWGWTGPNACYVENGSYKNRLIADYCVTACHYTPVVRNATCLNGTWPPVAKVKAIGRQVSPVKKVKCDPKCGTGVYHNAGTCQDDGKCLCFWGWTGPNAKYTTNNKILADYCRIPCHYTHDYANPECVNSNHTKHECVIPAKSDPKVPCDQRCGNPPNHGKGWCLRNGRCLCWWGWTGPDACYIDGGYFNNRILADYCERPCHYTHDVRNATCLNLNWITGNQIAKKELNEMFEV